jgi:hypothetical protein
MVLRYPFARVAKSGLHGVSKHVLGRAHEHQPCEMTVKLFQGFEVDSQMHKQWGSDRNR